MQKKIKITPSHEDYLETIYFLSKQNSSVRVTDVAAELGISKPSVNKAVNILKNKELVEHEHYGSLQLTEKGLEMAKSVADRHFVLKRFLKDLLKIDDTTAEEEACKIEHHISSNTITRLSKYLDDTLGKS